jgi:hypothetical protein
VLVEVPPLTVATHAPLELNIFLVITFPDWLYKVLGYIVVVVPTVFFTLLEKASYAYVEEPTDRRRFA